MSDTDRQSQRALYGPGPGRLAPAGHGSGGAFALSGARVAVVGSGEVLARVLGQLHTMGAGCIALEDPYRAAADIARRHDRYDAVVIALPCLYAEELPLIATLRRLAPTARIILAAADQHVSMLAAAMRFGASAVLTAQGIELLAASESLEPNPAVAGQSSTPLSPRAAEVETQREPEAEPVAEADQATDDEDAFNGGHPLLSAEELHALLHDEGEPLR